MTGRRYTKELLDEIIQQHNATLIGVYDDLNCETTIYFKCKCGVDNDKSFRSLTKKGAHCKPCMETLRLAKIKKTNLERHGVEHPIQSPTIKEKIDNTMLEKYGTKHALQNTYLKSKAEDTCMKNHGVKNPFESDKIKDLIKETNNLRYGADYVVESEIIKEKIRETNIERYGVSCSLLNEGVMDKIRTTNIERYGCEHPFQNSLVRDKFKQTNLERYEVEYPAQNQDVMERTQKNAKKYKEYTMPSGVIRKVQGYEHFALGELLKVYSENHIKTDRKEVPRIQYEMNEMKKYYFPDIFIPHENKIVEVKSTWTLNFKPEQIQLKKKACEDQGYNYEIWCYDGKGNKVTV
jgi:hypothetical protein